MPHDHARAVPLKPGASAPAEGPNAYSSLFDHSLDCVKLIDRDGRLMRINQCGCTALEICDPADAVGKSYFEFWSGTDAENARAAAEEAARTGAARFTGTYIQPSGKFSVWDEVLTSIRSASGDLTGYLIISRDITELTKGLNQHDALARLGALALGDGEFDDFLQTLTETLSDVLNCPLAKVLQFADEGDHLNLKAGVGWNPGLVGKAQVGVDRDSQAGYTLMVNRPVIVADLETEERFSGPLLLRQHKVRSGLSVVIPGEESRPFGVLGVHAQGLLQFTRMDADFLQSVAHLISARWRQHCARRDQLILMREMSHRSGNLLQVADSIFRQSLRFTSDIEAVKQNYSARLGSMARSSMALAKSGWSKISLHTLASETLSPFGDAIQVSGRDIVVEGELAFDLSMIWHELATNSAKYGALKSLEGEVRLSWSVVRHAEGQVLEIEWHDTSPPCSDTTGGGFGSRLIRQLVELKRKGTIEIVETPHYACKLSVPLLKGKD